MASGVSVESAAVQGGIGCCRTSMHELEAASNSLKGVISKPVRADGRIKNMRRLVESLKSAVVL